MELTATNRSQAYPEKVGLKKRERKSEKDLKKPRGCSILYVVLKVCVKKEEHVLSDIPR